MLSELYTCRAGQAKLLGMPVCLRSLQVTPMQGVLCSYALSASHQVCTSAPHMLVSCHRRQHQEDLVQQHFSLGYKDVVSSDCLLYGNYLVPGAEPKVRRIG